MVVSESGLLKRWRIAGDQIVVYDTDIYIYISIILDTWPSDFVFGATWIAHGYRNKGPNTIWVVQQLGSCHPRCFQVTLGGQQRFRLLFDTGWVTCDSWWDGEMFKQFPWFEPSEDDPRSLFLTYSWLEVMWIQHIMTYPPILRYHDILTSCDFYTLWQLTARGSSKLWVPSSGCSSSESIASEAKVCYTMMTRDAFCQYCNTRMINYKCLWQILKEKLLKV